jgi:hypothetical protein
MTTTTKESPLEIAESNFAMALDQIDEYPTPADALAAYCDNASSRCFSEHGDGNEAVIHFCRLAREAGYEI